jgi:hypothetical protein
MGAAAVTSGAIAGGSLGNAPIVGPWEVFSPGYRTSAAATAVVTLDATDRRRLRDRN